MRTFKKNVSLSSKELAEQRAAQTIYCNLNKTRRTNRTHIVNPDNSVSSSSQKDKLRIIRGKEVFLRKFGDENTQQNIHNRVIKDGDKLDKTTLDDFQKSEFNADLTAKGQVDYPADDICGNDNPDICQNYIYNLDIHGTFDNEGTDSNPTQEMSSDVYNTYQFFKKYPYTVDADGNINYSAMQCKPFANKEYEQADVGNTIYQKPKTLVGQKLTLINSDEFCS